MGESAPVHYTNNEPEAHTSYEQYDVAEETTYNEEPEEKNSGENVTSKIKGFFTNIFD